jgi:hypothetical protein
MFAAGEDTSEMSGPNHIAGIACTNFNELAQLSGRGREKDTAEDREAALKQGSRTKSSRTLTPEERQWRDDVVTFDSADDPQNPKNWSYRRKAFVTMLFGVTSS